MKRYHGNLLELIFQASDWKIDLTRDLALSLALDIAQGMKSLYDIGVLHFDLKTANCLIDLTSSNQCRAVVTDFGNFFSLSFLFSFLIVLFLQINIFLLHIYLWISNI